MSQRIYSEEKNFKNALIAGMSNSPDTPTREMVESKAKVMADLFEYKGDLQNVIIETLIAIETRMGIGESLIDTESIHDDQWVQRRPQNAWIYSQAYFDFLESEGWAPKLTQTLGDVTEKILGHLQDPRAEGTQWSRRGLVIGHVQSGKTANYTGVIARAADAGYKLIIVIAGIHNNLRKQTQARIDEAFIGRSSDPSKKRVPIGVGMQKDYPNPATLTNIRDDFNKNTAAKSGWKINDFSKPIILVIKKNVSTLDALHDWLKGLNANGGSQIRDVPMLLIDDEADNASINTNKEELDPTRTNATIRRILGLFAKSCYVGYTATPFANIFINPDELPDNVPDELFPRDFIYCLDAPTNYFGAEKVFINDETSKKALRFIDDAEELLPLGHKNNFEVKELPSSLYRAFDEFIIARAIRNLRGQHRKHCSMMVNVSRFVVVQKQVRELLRQQELKVRAAVGMYANMPDESASRNPLMQSLKEAFLDEYIDAGVSWDEVKKELPNVFTRFGLYVINSGSDDILEFVDDDSGGPGVTAVAVGGLSLSRGLTVEGLTISYMYRNTKMYDTLMQMGRWFGYRPNFEDLCRVHMSGDSADWYAHIAEAADELVLQVKRMRRDKLSPKEFGFYVQNHPDVLSITAANKMLSGEEVVVQKNYSGKLIECHQLSTDDSVNAANMKLLQDSWSAGFGGSTGEETEAKDLISGKVLVPSKGLIFRDVNISEIENFLRGFDVHSEFEGTKKVAIAYLSAIATANPRGDVVLISPGGIPEQAFALNTQKRSAQSNTNEGQTVNHIVGTSWNLPKGRVASKGDERLGLSKEQLERAEMNARTDAFRVMTEGKTEKERENAAIRVEKADAGRPVVSDWFYREQRAKPLLMIHSLEPTGNDALKGPIISFGISFPPGDYVTSVSVVANRIWMRKSSDTELIWEEEDEYDV
ncbi:MAG: Z1 domain-containing protein [Comamonas sp.]